MRPEGLKRSHWLKYNTYFALEHLLGYKSFKKRFGAKTKQLFAEIDQDFQNKHIVNKVEIPALDADSLKIIS
jgi:hypothetical protein